MGTSAAAFSLILALIATVVCPLRVSAAYSAARGEAYDEESYLDLVLDATVYDDFRGRDQAHWRFLNRLCRVPSFLASWNGAYMHTFEEVVAWRRREERLRHLVGAPASPVESGTSTATAAANTSAAATALPTTAAPFVTSAAATGPNVSAPLPPELTQVCGVYSVIGTATTIFKPLSPAANTTAAAVAAYRQRPMVAVRLSQARQPVLPYAGQRFLVTVFVRATEAARDALLRALNGQDPSPAVNAHYASMGIAAAHLLLDPAQLYAAADDPSQSTPDAFWSGGSGGVAAASGLSIGWSLIIAAGMMLVAAVVVVLHRRRLKKEVSIEALVGRGKRPNPDSDSSDSDRSEGALEAELEVDVGSWEVADLRGDLGATIEAVAARRGALQRMAAERSGAGDKGPILSAALQDGSWGTPARETQCPTAAAYIPEALTEALSVATRLPPAAGGKDAAPPPPTCRPKARRRRRKTIAGEGGDDWAFHDAGGAAWGFDGPAWGFDGADDYEHDTTQASELAAVPKAHRRLDPFSDEARQNLGLAARRLRQETQNVQFQVIQALSQPGYQTYDLAHHTFKPFQSTTAFARPQTSRFSHAAQVFEEWQDPSLPPRAAHGPPSAVAGEAEDAVAAVDHQPPSQSVPATRSENSAFRRAVGPPDASLGRRTSLPVLTLNDAPEDITPLTLE